MAAAPGAERTFSSPRDALDAGIATVYRDLAVVPLMSVWRNFFLGTELYSGFGPFSSLRVREMKAITTLGNFTKDEISLEEMTGPIAGGAELEALAHELAR